MATRAWDAVIHTPQLFRNVVVGGGLGATRILSGISADPNSGKTLIIAKDLPWMAKFPRHFEMGQTQKDLQLTKYQSDPYYLKQKMQTGEFMRQLVDLQFQATAGLSDDSDALETDVVSVIRHGGKYLLVCADGSVVLSDRVFMATGVGPERTLRDSGVEFENEVSDKRRVYGEVNTAIRCMEEQPLFWKNKVVAIYGAGATGAWVAEVAMNYGIRDLLWISKTGFQDANPFGRNSETLAMTTDRRITGEVLRLRYLGGGDTPPLHGGLELVVRERGKEEQKRAADIVISATGANALAATGIKTVLGSLYDKLKPYRGQQGGVYAALEDNSLFVVSSTIGGDFGKLIAANTFPVLNPENRVIAGIQATDLSSSAVWDAATGRFREPL
jgi:hypothetical protein